MLYRVTWMVDGIKRDRVFDSWVETAYFIFHCVVDKGRHIEVVPLGDEPQGEPGVGHG